MSSYGMLSMADREEHTTITLAGFKAKYQFIIKLGTALHAFGIEAYRLEAHLNRISHSQGITGSFLVTPTTLTFVFSSLDKQLEHTHVSRVKPGDIDLGKLADVNDVIEQLIAEEITVVQAHIRLNEIEASPPLYSSVLSLGAFGVSSGAFAMLIGTDWLNIVFATGLGIVCYLFVYCSQFYPRMTLGLEPLVACVNGLIAIGAHAIEPAIHVPLAVLSSIIIFIPGLSITLGLNELAARELISGTARLMDAVMLLFKLYFGAMLGIALGSKLWGEADIPDANVLPGWSAWVAVLILSTSLGAVFNVRYKDVVWGVGSGFLAYATGIAGIMLLGDALGYFIGALAVGLYGNLYAIWKKSPATVVLLQGIVVLVPGSKTYMGLNGLITGYSIVSDPNLGTNTFLVFMSLVAGLIFANIMLPTKQEL
ncbi:threonine/serine ThrE exporter family protein [Candidatus Sororendozoicomonas aggregata]|uniref:threonine/serine ThrE exporter family protein n=1 Tax=Candidatus Sororendozoicomonas aggregata TaxID=3073239 RepID=UPI002ED0FDEB